MKFNELGLSPELLQAVLDAGYTNPTPIQEQGIPVVATGRDVLGCAQTGTGKTASFALPMIDKLAAGRARARMPRSLIIEPTRELATQVEAAFEVYGKYHRLTTALLMCFLLAYLADRVGLAPGEVLGGDDALVGGLVSECRPMHEVADRIDALTRGALRTVDLHEPVLLELHAGVLEA